MTKASKTTSSVKIVDGKLILSLPNAKDPVVWQMDLAHAHAAAFTVKEDKKEKTFNLVFKIQGEESENIAPFDNKQSAVDILMETSEVLQSAHGKIQCSSSVKPAPTQDKKGDKLGAVLAIILIILLFLTWIFFSSASYKFAGNGSVSSRNYGTATGDPRQTSGVAVSADDFLSNR
jgi:hypothetical protein